MKQKIKAGIVGAAGYTGGELLRLLIHHPNVDIAFANSKSQTNSPVWNTHTDLFGSTDLTFTDENDFSKVDVLFLCSGHGQSAKFLHENTILEQVKIIDLSTDFRDESQGFTYGLPELQKDKISQSTRIANPGCFATSIELALLPLAAEGLLSNDIHVSAITGSTGAGQSLSATTHFSWRNNNISVYKAFRHQHLKEIGMSIQLLQANFNGDVRFLPYRGNFSRGIMANVYTNFAGSSEDAFKLYTKFYEEHPFTFVTQQDIDLKMVVNTNKCILKVEVLDGQILLSSIIDNLLKGASGQAVQNMNLLFGLPETTGLLLKPLAF